MNLNKILGFYICEHCDTKFLELNKFEKHKCELGRKNDLLKTKAGQSSFELYCFWFKCKQYRSPNHDIFLSSKYFNIFLELGQWAKNISLIDINIYVKYCTDRNLLPTLWRMNEVYSDFMARIDEIIPPLKQFELSCKTVYTLASVIDCLPTEIYEYLHFPEILNLIQSRKLSPWFLCFNKTFLLFVKNRTDKSERVQMSAMIDSEYWFAKFKKQPEIIAEIKK